VDVVIFNISYKTAEGIMIRFECKNLRVWKKEFEIDDSHPDVASAIDNPGGSARGDEVVAVIEKYFLKKQQEMVVSAVPDRISSRIETARWRVVLPEDNCLQIHLTDCPLDINGKRRPPDIIPDFIMMPELE